MIILNSRTSVPSLNAAHQVHLNQPQLLCRTIGANSTTVIAGRALGKTKGFTAIETADWLDSMPRCVIRIACYTYEGLKTNVLPGLIQGWTEILKYKEGTNDPKDGGHFWVAKMPPKKFKIHKPYRDPRGDVQYQIRWWNGSVVLLSSMDRGINNGGEFDAIAFEEVKLMKRNPVKEILLAKRGNADRFGHLSQYGAILKVTDRPEVHDPGRWVLDDAERVTPETNALIYQLCVEVARLNAEIDKAILAGQKPTAAKKRRLVAKYMGYINSLRKNAVNFVEASTLENIHALGIKTVVDYYNELDPYEYTISVLNKDPDSIPNSFYAALDRDTHGYRSLNFSYLEQLNVSDKSSIKRNVNWDNDTNTHLPLHIGCDHNAAINNIVTGQIMGKTAYIQSDLYVESPDNVISMAKRWCEYYETHSEKVVYYHFNPTSTSDKAQGGPTQSEDVINTLRAAGWSVIPEYHGTSEHHITQSLWSASLLGHPNLLEVRINLQGAVRLFDVMKKTGTRRSGNKTKKDKSSELYDSKAKKYRVPPPQATHVTEAADILLLGMQKQYYAYDLGPLISSFGYQ